MMIPTLWLLAGFVLILIEVMIPTLIFVFFGLSALIEIGRASCRERV